MKNKTDELKEFTECPKCGEAKEGIIIYKCKMCKISFCESCDSGNEMGKMCSCGSFHIGKVGIILPWTEKFGKY